MSTTSLRFFLHGLPAPVDAINQKLEESIHEQNGCPDKSGVLQELNQVGISQVVVGPEHLAFLLDDGTVKRIAYTVDCDSKPENAAALESASSRSRVGQEPPSKKSHVDTEVISNVGNVRTTSQVVQQAINDIQLQQRRNPRLYSSSTSTSSSSRAPASVVPSAAVIQASRRSAARRLGAEGLSHVHAPLTLSRSRGSASHLPAEATTAAHQVQPQQLASVSLHRTAVVDPLLNREVSVRRVTVPSSSVPEELVAQVQTILQGKSRRTVVRELLRTNLDVNTAVNNLLGREDDDVDESEEIASQNEMLISLMEDAMDPSAVESGAPPPYVPSASRYTLSGPWSSSNVSRDRREKPSSWNSAQPFAASAVFGNAVELLKFPDWETRPVPEFTAIGAMHSELVCLGEDGQIYQWQWSEPHAYAETPSLNLELEPGATPDNMEVSLNHTGFHPKSVALGLHKEQVAMMAVGSIRATFLTKSGKLATMVDESMSVLAKKLEHPATSFPELQGETVMEVNVSLLYTCVRVESGCLYWWGVMPLGYRHRLWEKSRTKPSKRPKQPSSSSDLHVGSTVVYRTGAVYQPGAIGFRVNIWGELQCGELLDNMWDLSSIARFRLLNPATGKPISPVKSSSSSSSNQDVRPVEHHVGTKRPSEIDPGDAKSVTESWQPKDVVIIDEGVKAPLIGQITKLTEDHAYVTFSQDLSGSETGSSRGLEDSKCIRKSDLALHRGAQSTSSTTKNTDSVQKTPKKLRISASCKKVLACAPNTRSIQMVVLGVSGKLSLVNYNLQSGKKDSQSRFLCEAKYILGNSENNIKLATGGRDGFTMMLDGNKCFYPLEKDNTGNLRVPHALNSSPVHSLNTYIRTITVPSRQGSKFPCAAVAFVVRKKSLVQSVFEIDAEKVTQILASTGGVLEKYLRECADGNRNILHVCAAVCAPQPRKDFPKNLQASRNDSDQALSRHILRDEDLLDFPLAEDFAVGPDHIHQLLKIRRGNMVEAMRRARGEGVDLARGRSGTDRHRPPNPEPPIQPEGMDTLLVDVPAPEETGPARAKRALEITKQICQHRGARKVLLELMAGKNCMSMTPFMYAVLIRSYEAALVLLDATFAAIKESYPELATGKQASVNARTVDSLAMDILYPAGSNPDDSPLFLLCLNDVCTYTWTGARHIQQDVWECRTCGLTGTLCCCTECARTCHRGHDCKIKRSSPTAYCDCWEKCKCQSLVSGDENFRLELFTKLANMSTDLVVRPNSKGEYLLQYLVHTVGRQLGEQRFLKSGRGEDRQQDLLNPPRFCQLALTLLLGNYDALKTTLMTGYPNPRLATFSTAVQEDQFHLSYQSGTALLDRFIHILLTKCKAEHIDVFVNTVRSAAGDLCEGQDVSIEAQEMTSRFVRSIVRVFVGLTAETSHSASTKNKSVSMQIPKPVQKIRDVFRRLPMSSVVELCEAAEALIAPVRLGVARPGASFSTSSAVTDHTSQRASDEVFNVEPLAERRRARGRREPLMSVPSSQGRDVDMDAVHAIPFEDEFDIVIPPDSSDRRLSDRASATGAIRVRTPPVFNASADNEPSSIFSIPSPPHGQPLHEMDVLANMSDMDIEEDPDSDGTDSENGNMPGFGDDSALRDADNLDRDPDSVAHETFSEENHSDSEHSSTGTHEEEDDEEEDEAESEEVDMDDGSNSIDGEDEHLYPLFMEAGRGGGLFRGGVPSMSSIYPARSSAGVSLPPGIQWAAQSSAARAAPRSSRELFGGGHPSTSSRGNTYVYMDSFGSFRKIGDGSSSSSTSFNTTFSSLARSYGIIIREVAELMAELRDPTVRSEDTDVSQIESNKMDRLENFVDESLKRTWSWVCNILDSTEAQLRFGYALYHSSEVVTAHPQRDRSSASASSRDHEEEMVMRSSHSLHLPSQRRTTRDGSAPARSDFLNYALSLMRSHNSEHGDSLPVIDVSALKHVAYIFDALINYVRVTTDASILLDLKKEIKDRTESSSVTWQDRVKEGLESLAKDFPTASSPIKSTSSERSSRSPEATRSHPFFRRSRSMCYLGSSQPDPFQKSLAETLPLADRPQILIPSARREELFGAKLVDYSSEIPSGSPASFKSPPVRLSLTNRQEDSRLWTPGTDSDDEYNTEEGTSAQSADDRSADASRTSARRKILGACITQDLVLGRWRQTLDIFSRVFAEDVGAEPTSLIGDIAPFPTREAKFRKEMERLRTSQQRDLVLNVARPRDDLIPESFALLNVFFNKRSSLPGPHACSKLKVTFRDEPGEGNGVARSYFTAIGEALLSQTEKLPQLDRPAPVIPPTSHAHSHAERVRWMQPADTSRLRFMRESVHSRRTISEGDVLDLESRISRTWPDVNAPPFRPSGGSAHRHGMSAERAEMAEAVQRNIGSSRPSLSASTVQQVTGMLMQLDMSTLERILTDPDTLSARVDLAMQALANQRGPDAVYHSADYGMLMPSDYSYQPMAAQVPTVKSPVKESDTGVNHDEKLNDDDEPLFYEPGRPGNYAVRPGKNSAARLTAFKNVGRLIGLALLQGEILPVCLTRATVKHILGRQVNWSDFAFHDPVMFETLRKMVVDVENGMSNKELADLCMYFSIDVPVEEGNKELELESNGRERVVTRENIYEFVKLATEARMLRVAQKALDALKRGVHEVIGHDALDLLMPEDFRLLLNGVDRAIDIQQLASWTNWQDETNDKTQDKTKFKHWFWNTVDRLNPDEKQELLYFWTGSSAMPASEAGFAPLPSITIRPADDIHLPTANTCISRLYIPLYSAKPIIRSKLLLAIKTKNFGFV